MTSVDSPGTGQLVRRWRGSPNGTSSCRSLPTCSGIPRQRRGGSASIRDAFERAVQADVERQHFEAYNAPVRRMAAERDVELVDLANVFRERRQSRQLADLVHPTPDGHRLTAGTLAAHIREAGGADVRSEARPDGADGGRHGGELARIRQW